jgi:hypothetical protein
MKSKACKARRLRSFFNNIKRLDTLAIELSEFSKARDRTAGLEIDPNQAPGVPTNPINQLHQAFT